MVVIARGKSKLYKYPNQIELINKDTVNNARITEEESDLIHEFRNNKEYYKKFLDNFGIDLQIMVCIEEMSELTKALCKYKRYGKKEYNKELINNVLEEIADVKIMVEELELYFGRDEI